VPWVHSDNSNADRIGGFNGRGGGCFGEQASLETDRDENLSKIKKEKTWDQRTSK
jgi:hypothetical protein